MVRNLGLCIIVQRAFHRHDESNEMFQKLDYKLSMI